MKIMRITVVVPYYEAGAEVADKIASAVFDAAYEAQPEDREKWDIFAYSTVVDEPLYDED